MARNSWERIGFFFGEEEIEFLAGEVPLTVFGLGILVAADNGFIPGEFPSIELLKGDDTPRETDEALPL